MGLDKEKWKMNAQDPYDWHNSRHGLKASMIQRMNSLDFLVVLNYWSRSYLKKFDIETLANNTDSWYIYILFFCHFQLNQSEMVDKWA